MAKKSSSKRWLNEHHNDVFVKKARQDGYRSRAVYKLLEAIDKYQFIQKGDNVLDLGAAPGAWSQLALEKVGNQGRVIALDILPMKPITDVSFIQGDFRQNEVADKIKQQLGTRNVNVLLSDMAPNMSGQLSVDLPKSMYLAELALDLALETLSKQGYFFVKLFQGVGFDAYLKNVRAHFEKQYMIKPSASRSRSKEVYLLANRLK